MFSVSTKPTTILAIAIVVIVLLRTVGIAIFRLYYSPLSNFPGPKLAALTKWYEFYYDVVKQGQFTFRIQKMHRQYGPIVRITPFELHIEDSTYWDKLYSRSSRYDKYEWMAGRFGANTMTFTTANSDLHALRRAPLNPMFSKRSIAIFEPVIKEKVEVLCKGIAESLKSPDRILVLSDAFSAYAGDVITEYCFGFCYDHLKSPRFQDNFHKAFMAVSAFGHLALQFPMMHQIMNALPASLVQAVTPDLQNILMLQKDLRVKIAGIMDKGNEVDSKHPTIFHELLDSDLPLHEKSIDRLGDEAQLFIGAGLETTSWALTTTSFHLLSNPQILATLRAELKDAMPNPSKILDSRGLENLPYLTACIQEGIRLSYGVSSRNPRVSPDKYMQYKDWKIPPGTPVSMTIIDIHNDDTLYPNSRSFIPERWLDNPQTGEETPLRKYFVAFGKGPRSCLGINLAYTELYLALAMVFRRFEFELYHTDHSDVELAHDFFLPSPKLDSKGVRVKIKSMSLI